MESTHKSFKYNGEQTLSVDGHIITKGHNSVPNEVHAKLQDTKWQEQHGGAKNFEFAAAQKPVGGTDAKKLSPTDTNSFGTNEKIADKQISRDLAPDTDIPGDSEQKMVGGSEDKQDEKVEPQNKHAQVKAQQERTAEGKINSNKSSKA